MKNSIVFILCATLFSCGKEVVSKPDKQIEKEQMIDVLYDLALLEAIKTNQPSSLERNGIDPENYVFKKYNIDSTQFAQNNKFYASDIENYAKMYQKVTERLENNRALLDSIKTNQKENKNEGQLGGKPPVMN